MRARVELSDSERKILVRLDDEEREALVEQMLATVREELEWEVAVERAHQAAATAQARMQTIAPRPSPPRPPSALPTRSLPKFSWSSSPRRAAR